MTAKSRSSGVAIRSHTVDTPDRCLMVAGARPAIGLYTIICLIAEQTRHKKIKPVTAVTTKPY